MIQSASYLVCFGKREREKKIEKKTREKKVKKIREKKERKRKKKCEEKKERRKKTKKSAPTFSAESWSQSC